MTVSDYRTEEYQVGDTDFIVIEWDGETRTIRTYTLGTSDPLYTGNSLDEAAESLEIDRDTLDSCLMGDPVVRDANGEIL